MSTTPNFHAIEVKFTHAEVRGARVNLRSLRFERDRVSLPYDHGTGHVRDQAEQWLRDNGYAPIGVAEGHNSYLIFCETFRPLRVVEFEVQGNYGGVAGWELLTAEDSLAEARLRMHEYQDNSPEGIYRVRTIKR